MIEGLAHISEGLVLQSEEGRQVERTFCPREKQRSLFLPWWIWKQKAQNSTKPHSLLEVSWDLWPPGARPICKGFMASQQCHHVGTKCSTTWAGKGHFIFKTHTLISMLYKKKKKSKKLNLTEIWNHVFKWYDGLNFFWDKFLFFFFSLWDGYEVAVYVLVTQVSNFLFF